MELQARLGRKAHRDRKASKAPREIQARQGHRVLEEPQELLAQQGRKDRRDRKGLRGARVIKQPHVVVCIIDTTAIPFPEEGHGAARRIVWKTSRVVLPSYMYAGYALHNKREENHVYSRFSAYPR